MKSVRFALVMIALFAVIAIIGSVACAGPFNRCPVIVENMPVCPTVAAPAPVAAECGRIEAVPAADRCLLPWNCPNGKCRQPREEVIVNVAPPKCDCPQPTISTCAQPAEEPPFPFGLLLLVVVPVVVISAVAAFFIRVGSAGSK